MALARGVLLCLTMARGQR